MRRKEIMYRNSLQLQLVKGTHEICAHIHRFLHKKNKKIISFYVSDHPLVVRSHFVHQL